MLYLGLAHKINTFTFYPFFGHFYTVWGAFISSTHVAKRLYKKMFTQKVKGELKKSFLKGKKFVPKKYKSIYRVS